MAKEKLSKSQGVMHVQIEGPIDLRKQILNTAISSAEILKHYEVIREIKHRKKQYQEKLNDVLAEINELKAVLEDSLPEVKDLEHKKPKYTAPMTPLPKPKEEKQKLEKRSFKKQRSPHRSPLEKEIESMRRKLELL